MLHDTPPKASCSAENKRKNTEEERRFPPRRLASTRPDDVALAPRRRHRRRGRRPGGGARAAARRPRPRGVRAHRRRGRHLGLRRRRRRRRARLAVRPAALEPLRVPPHQPPPRVHGLPRLPLRRRPRPRRRRPQVPRPRGGAPVPRGLRAAVRPPRPRPARDGGGPGEQGGGLALELALACQVLEEGRNGGGVGGVRRRRRLQRPLLPAALRRRRRPGCLAGEAAAQHQLPRARAIPRPGGGGHRVWTEWHGHLKGHRWRRQRGPYRRYIGPRCHLREAAWTCQSLASFHDRACPGRRQCGLRRRQSGQRGCHHALQRIRIQFPIPRRRLNHLRGRQLCCSTLQACFSAAGCSSTLLHRATDQGSPFPALRAPEQLGGRRSVGADRAPVRGGDDARRDGLALASARSRMAPKIHPQAARPRVRERGLARGAMPARGGRGVEAGDVLRGDEGHGGASGHIPGRVGRRGLRPLAGPSKPGLRGASSRPVRTLTPCSSC